MYMMIFFSKPLENTSLKNWCKLVTGITVYKDLFMLLFSCDQAMSAKNRQISNLQWMFINSLESHYEALDGGEINNRYK